MQEDGGFVTTQKLGAFVAFGPFFYFGKRKSFTYQKNGISLLMMYIPWVGEMVVSHAQGFEIGKKYYPLLIHDYINSLKINRS